ncbi:MAG: SDR family oxidoreductase [Proteobacteria bacterium]|nr:SDR family oxidoreductase [Pseudomonadota bacterium]
MSQLKNKIALVTGASRGVGAATALLLAENGYSIAVNFLKNQKQAAEIVAKAKSFGVSAIEVQANLGDEQEIIKMFKKIDAELGAVTALVNNGGISGGKKSIEEIDFKYLQEVYSINVFGTFICCREAINRMKKNGGGAIVNVSSLAAKTAGFQMSAYSSSKAAINNFTIGLSREAAELNIRINAVALGVIDTDTHVGISQERLIHLNNSVPLKRMGTSSEAAEAIFWLLSEKSSYVTGSILEVTGGK